MTDNVLDIQELARGSTIGKLRNDLNRCVARAEALGLTAIAIYLQRAIDELAEISG
jgi:hypothetical protein